MLGVRFLITGPSFEAPEGWLLRYEGPDGKLFESTAWKRRFFISRGAATIGRIVQETPTRLTIDIDAHEPSFVASSQVLTRGWRISDGRSIVPVENTFIGFEVAPGRHRVQLEYAPRSFTMSLIIAATALLLAASTLQRRRTQ